MNTVMIVGLLLMCPILSIVLSLFCYLLVCMIREAPTETVKKWKNLRNASNFNEFMEELFPVLALVAFIGFLVLMVGISIEGKKIKRTNAPTQIEQGDK